MRSKSFLATLLALVPLAAPPATGRAGVQEGGAETSFVVSIDCELARQRVWLLDGIEDPQVRQAAGRVIARRIQALGHPARFTVDDERDQLTLTVGGTLTSPERDGIDSMLRSLGLCELLLVVDDKLAASLGLDLAAERRRLGAWREAHPGQPLEKFNILEEGGPDRRISWVTLDPDSVSGGGPTLGWPVLLPSRADEYFGAASLERTTIQPAEPGSQALEVRLEVRSELQAPLAHFTGQHVGQRLAVLVGGRLISAPRIDSPFRKYVPVNGRFDEAKALQWQGVLRALEGPLRLIEVR